MIKVLNILSDSNIGGAGRLLVNYLRNFDRTKFDVAVVLPKDSDLKPCVLETGFSVFEIEHGRDKSFDIKAVREVMHIINEWKPDVVHTHSSFYGKLAAFLCGTHSRFYTRHSAFPQPKKLTTFPGKQINGLINGMLSTDIVAVAKAAMDNLTDTGVNPKKITVIINGVDEVRRTSSDEQKALKEKLGIAPSTFVFGISARLESYKGHVYLLEATKIVVGNHPDIRVLIIGGGTYESELRKKTAELGIEDKVIFTGFVDDVAPYYNIMDLNINCSIGTETSSLALSEGFSLSVPAIASTYGGNPYMVTDGVNGYLVPERDPESLAEKMTLLIEDRDLLSKLSAGAREMYEKKFTASVMTRQLEDLYIKSVNR